MIIAGDANGEFWIKFQRKAATVVGDRYDFILRKLENIGKGFPNRCRLFTKGNLFLHIHRTIIRLLISRGFRIFFRAPYYMHSTSYYLCIFLLIVVFVYY